MAHHGADGLGTGSACHRGIGHGCGGGLLTSCNVERGKTVEFSILEDNVKRVSVVELLNILMIVLSFDAIQRYKFTT